MRLLQKHLILLAGLLPLSLIAAETLETVTSARISMPLEYRVDGVVEARQQATLSAEVAGKVSAEVAGKVESVNFDVDDFVEQGEIILRIRDRDYQAQQKKARAALNEAEASLQDMQLEYRRSQDLRKQKLISQADFDKARANLKAAQARKSAADANLAQADEQLGHTVLRAPYSGVVVERHVEPGEAVNPGQPIMTGYGLGELRVTAMVPQSMIGELRQRRSAQVILLEDGQALEVSKITIHPFANPKNHSFPVRLDLPQTDTALYPGMLVKVAIAIGSTERLLLPQRALVSRSEVNAVYVIAADGKLALRQVRPGNRYGESRWRFSPVSTKTRSSRSIRCAPESNTNASWTPSSEKFDGAVRAGGEGVFAVGNYALAGADRIIARHLCRAGNAARRRAANQCHFRQRANPVSGRNRLRGRAGGQHPGRAGVVGNRRHRTRLLGIEARGRHPDRSIRGRRGSLAGYRQAL
jgi:RND family efflux transporter MFP subunit